MYVVLHTDTALSGHGLSFPTRAEAAACVDAARYIAGLLVGLDVDGLAGSLGHTYRRLVGDNRSGADADVGRYGATAVLNAVWDLMARFARKPLWRLLSEMAPTDLVAACDFRDQSGVLAEHDAVEMLEWLAPTRQERIRHLARVGYPAYTTAPARLGLSDNELRRWCRDAVTDGWHSIKVEVGRSFDRNKRRLAMARDELGPDGTLLLEANGVWEVPEAIAHLSELAQFGPLRVERPTRPEDIAGHATIRTAVAPVAVTAGEQCRDALAVKRMLDAGALDYLQVDACRSLSVNEIVPVLLIAARSGVAVSYRGGGAGLCGPVQHLAMLDFICISGSLIGRLIEHVDVSQQHFSNPPIVQPAWYRLPAGPGYGARMRTESLVTYRYPDGTYWAGAGSRGR
ncbi:enolase C-terminal domain-like protein [Virgisporangium ochraceum]|uniref:enolase C-terminal domain-like protein n=1 Tax=Virgisporangium ochraceum TaxID=65505 RepID=UPI001EF332A5|nr:enolase C-terminal domain-like protein [Virgisporangium ochraceum]